MTWPIMQPASAPLTSAATPTATQAPPQTHLSTDPAPTQASPAVEMKPDTSLRSRAPLRRLQPRSPQRLPSSHRCTSQRRASRKQSIRERWRAEGDWARARQPGLLAQAQEGTPNLQDWPWSVSQETSATRVRRLPDSVPELHEQALQEDLRTVRNGTPRPSLQRVLQTPRQVRPGRCLVLTSP